MPKEQNQEEMILYDLAIIYSMGREDDEFLKEIAGIFISTMPVSMAALLAALQDNNLDQARKIAHKMKSSIDLFGIHTLYGPIRQLETITKIDAIIDSQVDIIDNVLKKVYAQLKEHI